MTELYNVPVGDRFVVYRPLLRLAFVGNRAMADLASHLAGQIGRPGESDERPAGAAQAEAAEFLRSIGFLEPDPAPPPPPDESYRPATAVLLLTSRCNLRCTYCYADGGVGPQQDLSYELAQVAIDHVERNAREQGLAQFDVTFHGGGEPAQAWGLMEQAVAHARGKTLPARISMVSNGVWTARQREWILHHLDFLSISFDGAPETQDSQRPFAGGRGSSRAVLRTISALDAASFSYGIRLTATAPWRGRLAEDVRYICRETGCKAMQVEPAFNARRGEHQGPLFEEAAAFADAFIEAFEVASGLGRNLTFSGARPWLLTQVFCTAPYGALVVNPAGKLVACYEVADGDHPLAGLSTLGRIVDGCVEIDAEAQRAFRSFLESSRAACAGCFCRWHCAGDCYSRAAAAGRRYPHGPSPRCAMNREITARLLLWYIMQSDGVWRGQGGYPQAAHLMQQF